MKSRNRITLSLTAVVCFRSCSGGSCQWTRARSRPRIFCFSTTNETRNTSRSWYRRRKSSRRTYSGTRTSAGLLNNRSTRSADSWALSEFPTIGVPLTPKPIKINLNWLFIIGGVLGLIDLWFPHAEHVYRNDPATILISLAVTAITTGAQYGAQALLTKKVKPTPVDRGKVDDIRISSPGYGVLIPWGRGTFRVAPIWFWHTPIVHTTKTTPGQSGGKGTPSPPTPDTVDHIYTTNLEGAVHDGLIYKGFSRIWFNADLVYNANLATNFADTASTRYEAEFGVLGGGASVAAQAECSEGNKVTGLGSGGTVTIHCDVATSGSYELAVFYTSTVQRTFKVSVNGGATVDLVCPPSGGANMVRVETLTRTLTSGANTITFSNSGAACPDLDCIDITPGLVFVPGGPGGGEDPRSFTGLIRPGRIAPLDADIQWPTVNELPTFSDTAGGVTAGGFYTATLSKWGNPQIRMYPGSETQEPDPIIIADQGVDGAPAYRGTGYLGTRGRQIGRAHGWTPVTSLSR